MYAIVPAATRARTAWHGSGEAPLRVVRFGDLAVLVGDVDIAPQLSRQALQEHDALIRQIAAIVPALLPARFGFVMSLDELRGAIEPNRRSLRAALRLVTDREQMTMRVRLPPAPAVTATPAPGGSGTNYLSARAAELRTPYGLALTELLQRLTSLIHAEHVERSRERLTLYHLIDRGRSADYLTIASGFMSDHQESLATIAGPFPPYAFAPRLL